MAAMLRTVKASPGCRPRVTDGHTRESAQANTMYCMQQRKIHHQVGKKREHARKTCPVPMALIDKQVGRSARSVEDYTQNQKAATFEF